MFIFTDSVTKTTYKLSKVALDRWVNEACLMSDDDQHMLLHVLMYGQNLSFHDILFMVEMERMREANARLTTYVIHTQTIKFPNCPY